MVDALGGWRPRSICEVGCGAGEILRILHDRLEPDRSVGFEIAPAAHELCLGRTTGGLESCSATRPRSGSASTSCC